MKKVLLVIAAIIVVAFISIYMSARPTSTSDGAFIPSPLALKLATVSTTDFDHTIYERPYKGSSKVLMVCTEERNMVMANGKAFSTGNHRSESVV